MKENLMILDKKLDESRLVNRSGGSFLREKVSEKNFGTNSEQKFLTRNGGEKPGGKKQAFIRNPYEKRTEDVLKQRFDTGAGLCERFSEKQACKAGWERLSANAELIEKKNPLKQNTGFQRADQTINSDCSAHKRLNYAEQYKAIVRMSCPALANEERERGGVGKENIIEQAQSQKKEGNNLFFSVRATSEGQSTLKYDFLEKDYSKSSFKERGVYRLENAVLRWSEKVKNQEDSAEADAALNALVKASDFGIRSKRAIQSSVTGMKRAEKSAKTAAQKMKSARQSFVRAKKAKETKEKISEAYSVSKNIVIAVSNMLKATVELIAAAPVVFIIIGVLALICVLGTSLSSFLMTQHSASPETLSSIYQYVKEKSTDVGYEFQNYKRVHSPAFDDIEDADVTLDARVTPFSEPTDKIVNYFSAKYEDELSLEIAKDEIDAIMSSLFTISHEIGERTEVIEKEVEKPVLDDDGEPVLDGDGNPLTETVIEMEEKTFRTLRVILDGITFEEWFEANAHLDKVQKQRYDIFNEMQNLGVGGAGNIGSINSPFPDSWSVSSPFGSRVNPKTGEREFHRGVDIPKPGGTPIYAVASGTVTSTTGHWTYGNTFVITGTAPDGTLSVRYAHCQSFVVHDGQSIKAGDLVGYVGTTGASTGNHLHIEMLLNGTLINPMLYLQNPGAI